MTDKRCLLNSRDKLIEHCIVLYTFSAFKNSEFINAISFIPNELLCTGCVLYLNTFIVHGNHLTTQPADIGKGTLMDFKSFSSI